MKKEELKKWINSVKNNKFKDVFGLLNDDNLEYAFF